MNEPDESTRLAALNAAQQSAVETIDGPVLVLAGAGTGKTRVLTARLAHLLEAGAAVPAQVLAVTFTNKAANEIRERVSALLGRSVEGWFLGTFHSLAARLLRPHAERVGLKSNFTIVGTDDQLRLIKQLLQAENIDDKKFPPRHVLGVIERWKDRGLEPSAVRNEVSDIANGKMPKLYALYQERLKDLNACDFGDLMLHQLTLLRENPDILAALQKRFRYILVDEYQDTNVAQYLWLRLLAKDHQNICCVGDEDQSIYGWRGAEIGNILRFEEDFPGAKVVRLEENYRSTGNILSAAAHLISHNRMRLGKTLWTQAPSGDKVHIHAHWDGEAEARWVADEVETLQRRHISLNEMAIMVRAGFQTRQFEERFIFLGIPYRVLVGARFYERQEIRDAIAYLRILISDDDDLAYERIINVPKRGIGPATIQQITAYARAEHIPLCTAATTLASTDELKPKMRATFLLLAQNIARWRTLLETLPHNEVAQIVLDESGYTGMWQADKAPDAPSRLENLKELISAMASFDTLPSFLEHVSLVLETTEQHDAPQISIMTLHGSKGLEFNYVFLPGWEEEIFPSRMSLSENGERGLEEERRLAYVGLTRARKKAWISYVANRQMYGTWNNAIPSRFIDELPKENVDHVSSLRNTSASEWKPREKKPPSLWQQMSVSRKTPQASLIEGTARQIQTPPASSKWQLGMRVSHEKFGNGIIISVDQNKLEISFETVGKKKVIETFIKKSAS